MKKANYTKLGGGNAEIIATLISRSNQTILVQFCSENNKQFIEVINKVIVAKKLPQGENIRKSYKYEERFFLHYFNDNLISVIAISDVEYSSRVAFAFLQDIYQKFNAHYARETILLAKDNAMQGQFSRIIQERMHFFNTDPQADKILDLQNKVQGVTEIMHENLNKILERGEKIELLLTKAEELESSAVTFKKSSRQLKRTMWCRNFKLNILLAVIVLVLVGFFVLVIACGGFSFKNC